MHVKTCISLVLAVLKYRKIIRFNVDNAFKYIRLFRIEVPGRAKDLTKVLQLTWAINFVLMKILLAIGFDVARENRLH